MAKYLTQEWHDQAKVFAETFPERPGASVRMAFHIAGGPDGEVKYYQVIENGKLLEQANGTLPDADVTMSMTWADSVAMQKGDLDANAAMMQGKVKIAGNMAKVMALLPLSMSAEYKQIQEQIRNATEYD